MMIIRQLDGQSMLRSDYNRHPPCKNTRMCHHNMVVGQAHRNCTDQGSSAWSRPGTRNPEELLRTEQPTDKAQEMHLRPRRRQHWSPRVEKLVDQNQPYPLTWLWPEAPATMQQLR